jgi:hypothetical protein
LVCPCPSLRMHIAPSALFDIDRHTKAHTCTYIHTDSHILYLHTHALDHDRCLATLRYTKTVYRVLYLDRVLGLMMALSGSAYKIFGLNRSTSALD